MASPAPFYGQYRIPGVDEQVHFGVGQPAPSLLPLTRVRAATAAKLAEEDPLLLQYGFISCYATFRASLARFLEAGYGKPAGSVDPELLFATNGVSGALGLVCSLFAGRGDSCVVENPSYFLALSIFRDFGIRTTPCRLDEQGLDTAELERMLRADAGFRPKFVYCIPAFHNPTGYSLSAERKAHLCCLAAEFDFLVLVRGCARSLSRAALVQALVAALPKRSLRLPLAHCPPCPFLSSRRPTRCTSCWALSRRRGPRTRCATSTRPRWLRLAGAAEPRATC